MALIEVEGGEVQSESVPRRSAVEDEEGSMQEEKRSGLRLWQRETREESKRLRKMLSVREG